MKIVQYITSGADASTLVLDKNVTSIVQLIGTFVGGDASGAGDVFGTTNSTDGNVVVFDGITGKYIKDSGVNLSNLAIDSGNFPII